MGVAVRSGWRSGRTANPAATARTIFPGPSHLRSRPAYLAPAQPCRRHSSSPTMRTRSWPTRRKAQLRAWQVSDRGSHGTWARGDGGKAGCPAAARSLLTRCCMRARCARVRAARGGWAASACARTGALLGSARRRGDRGHLVWQGPRKRGTPFFRQARPGPIARPRRAPRQRDPL